MGRNRYVEDIIMKEVFTIFGIRSNKKELVLLFKSRGGGGGDLVPTFLSGKISNQQKQSLDICCQ